MTTATRTRTLPDPYTHGDLYSDVPVKRLIAWGVDFAIIAAITFVISLASLFTLAFLLPLFMTVSFVYRWWSLSARSATPGMRFAAIEIVEHDGHRLSGMTAFLHTLGYTISVVTFPLQLISIAMMLMTARKQGLTDMILGTAAINRRAY